MKNKEYSKPEMQVIELHQQLLLQVTSPLPFTIYDDTEDAIVDEGDIM